MPDEDTTYFMCQVSRHLSSVLLSFNQELLEFCGFLEKSYNLGAEVIPENQPNSKTGFSYSNRTTKNSYLNSNRQSLEDSNGLPSKLKTFHISSSSPIAKVRRKRNNWSIEEHFRFLKLVEKCSDLPEEILMRKLLHAFGKTRSLPQIKCRFRCLLANNVILNCSLGKAKLKDKKERWKISMRAYDPPPFRRVNWRSEEDEILSQTINDHYTLDQSALVLEITSRLNGRRTWNQVNRHFNLLKESGRVKQTTTAPFVWYKPQ